MTNELKKLTKIPTFYLALAIMDFTYSIINIAQSMLYGNFDFGQFCSFLVREIIYLIPLVSLIYISKKVEQIEDLQLKLKIKKYMIIYLIATIGFGVVYFIFGRLLHWYIPLIPTCLFYAHSWLYSLTGVFQFQSIKSIITFIFDVCFWIISIMFVKSLGKEEAIEEYKEESGKTSKGFILGIISIVLLCIQTTLNISIALSIHENSHDTGEHALGTAFLLLILIAIKVLLAFIILPVIPLSITGIVLSNSKKEIAQDRKQRQTGRIINITCLVIAGCELLFLW